MYINVGRSQLCSIFSSIYHKNTTYYNRYTLEKLSPDIDLIKLKNAVNRVILAHPILRTIFKNEHGSNIVQQFSGSVSAQIIRMSDSDFNQKCMILRTPCQMLLSPLAHFEIYQTPSGNYFFQQIHASICDNESFEIIAKEILSAYNDKELQSEQYTIEDRIHEELENDVKKASEYYQNLLKVNNYESVLQRDVYGEIANQKWDEREISLDENLLSEITHRINIDNQAFFSSIIAFVVGKFINNPFISLSLNTPRIPDEKNSNTVAPLNQVISLLLDTSSQKISDYLTTTFRNISSLLEYPGFSAFDAGELGISNELEFEYLEHPLTSRVFPSSISLTESLNCRDSDQDCVLSLKIVHSATGTFHLKIDYPGNMFSSELIQSFMDSIVQACHEFLSCEHLGEVSLLSESSLKKLDEFNATEEYIDKEKTVVSLFREHEAKHPNTTAVVYLDKRYTYHQADDISERIANYIVGKGIGRGDFVSILISRSEYMPLASLGVLKASAVFQPLDSTYPEDRLNYMLNDCKPKLLICDRDLRNLVPKYTGDILYTDEIPHLPPVSRELPEPRYDDSFCIIYTSGTTGNPKGCIIQHINVSDIAQCISKLRFDEKTRFCSHSNFSFVTNLMDTWTTLTTGGELHILDESIRLDIIELEKYFVENKITHTFMTTHIGKQFAEFTKCPSLKIFSIGGETVKLINPPEDCKYINGYGMTETAGCVSTQIISNNSPLLLIGKPTTNTKFYVLDENMHRLPIGAYGELYVSGLHLSKGYLHLPEKTNNSFIKNPFSDKEDYSRLYRTGDFVRLLPDGNYNIVGRFDKQVKIRGFRVELKEVEKIILSYPGVKEVLAIDYDDPSGGKFLAAYLVSNKDINTSELQKYIRLSKPPYMVPSVIMQIDSIPLNSNGKVDRFALPVPENRSIGEIIPPKSLVQKKIFDIISDIIGISNFGITTNFFEAGLNSIGTARATVLLAQEFNIAVRTKDILDNPTIEDFEHFVLSSSKDITYNILSDYPLSKSQEGICVESELHPDTCVYNIPVLIKISGKIKIDLLKRAIVEAVKAHPYIDTRLFVDEKGDFRQKRSQISFSESDIQVIKCESLESVKDSLVRPYNIFGNRLFRITIIDSDVVYLFLDMHHIIGDGMSESILLHDINAAYQGEKLKGEKYSYYEYVLQKEKEQENNENAKEYFKNLLDDYDTDMLPRSDLYEPEDISFGEQYEVCPGYLKIANFCKKSEISPNGFFTAAFGLLVAKYICSDYAIVSAIHHGRDDSRFAQSLGMMVQTIPVVCNVENIPVHDYLRRISSQIHNSQMNSSYSFAEISHDFGIRSDLLFVYEGDNFNVDSFCGYPSSVIPISLGTAKSPINLTVSIENDNIHIHAEYNAQIYSQNFISSLVSAYKKILNEFLTKENLSEILLVDEEMVSHLDAFNETDVSYDRTKTVIDFFTEQVEKTPEKTAVVYLDKRYTYREVDTISNNLASYIEGKGIGKDNFVAILIPRCEFMPILPLGILKAGAAYQPLDPGYPRERLNFMINDSGASLLICDRSMRDLVDEYKGDVLYTDEVFSLPPGMRIQNPPTVDNAFVILYTSGTTGVPKGCIIEHRNLSEFVQWFITRGSVTESTKQTSHASYGFDCNMMEMYPTLCVGGELHILDESIRLDLPILEKYFVENKITNAFMSTQVGRQFALYTHCKTLKHLTLVGESLTPLNPPKDFELINGYGPTETTIIVTAYHVVKNSNLLPIGTPSNNTKFYVLDNYKNRLPAGAVGELYISGIHVTRGYLNRPEKTAEVFLENPFTSNPDYIRMYKTGDLVRILPDGNYDIIGRRDTQVKISGFRLELREVEQKILDFEGIKDATATAFDYPAGGKYLVAYIVADKKIDIEKLNAFIRETKPYYMVPSITIQLDKIPLNQNGKVNKRALPKPEITVSKDVIPPKNEMQKKLFDIISDIIGTSNFGITDDIFDAGLNSIGSIKLTVLLSKEFNITVLTKDIKNNSTVEHLEKYVLSSLPLEKFEIYEDYPISKSQEGIYVESSLHPNTCIYNIPSLLRIGESLNINKLKSAIVDTIKAHPYLETHLFVDKNGDIRQRRMNVSYSESDIEVLSVESIDEIKSRIVAPFNLHNSRLFRIKIIQEKSLYLFIDIHHILRDGMSGSILIRDIERAYNGEKLVPEIYSGYEYALEKEREHAGHDYEEAKLYYENLLDGYDTDMLPKSDLYEPGLTSYGEIDEILGIYDNVLKFVTQNKVTPNSFFTSAFGFVLAKYNGTDYSVFAGVHNGRTDSRFTDTVAMMVQTIPVVCKINDTKIIDYISNVSQELLNSQMNSSYSFAEISHDLNVTSNVLFIYEGDDFNVESFCGFPIESINIPLGEPKAPIDFTVTVVGNDVEIHVEYDASRFSNQFITSILSSYKKVISDFLKVEKLSDVDLLDSQMVSQIDSFNETDEPYDMKRTVVDFFTAQVEKTPDKTAVVYLDNRYTYRDVETISNKIAQYIVGKGIGSDNFVAILLPRSGYMPITALGVLKSGAAYQPLDSTYPKNRLNFMIKDSGAMLLICDRSLRELVNEYDGDILYIDEIDLLPCSSGNNLPVPKLGDAAIILYTSGTTGNPKGCVLEHRNIAKLSQWLGKRMKVSESTRYASYASFGFDVNMHDLVVTLCSGGELHIIDEAIRLELFKIDEYFIRNNITHTYMTTQVGRQFAILTKCTSLQCMTVAGETLVPLIPPNGFEFINAYGPTETMTVTAYHVASDSPLLPIGKPCSNTKFYILDSNGKRLPIGAVGELYISGVDVSRGYLNLPEKTAEVFIRNPYTDIPQFSRMYRTGDIVRLLPDGNYDIIGRRDGQVKIRGFRVELKEVEHVIRDYKGIKDVTLVAFENDAGDKYLVSYVVSDNKVDSEDLKAFIRSKLPDYMVPSVIMQIDKIPLNQNSKVNKRALPKPEFQISGDLIPPKTEIQKKIFEIVASVIGTSNFGITTDIFNAGLNSMGSIKLNVLLSQEFNIPVQTRDLKENYTVELLEKFVLTSDKLEELEKFPDYPLIGMQKKYYPAYASMEGDLAWQVVNFYKIGNNIDINRLKSSIVKAVNAHPYLKTKIFVGEDGEPRQKRLDEDVYDESYIQVVVAESLDSVKSSLVTGFPLHNNRLFMVKIIKTDDGLYLLINMHHILTDGSSMRFFLEDISTAYTDGELTPEKYSWYEMVTVDLEKRNQDSIIKANNYLITMFGEVSNRSPLPYESYLKNDIFPTSDMYVSRDSLYPKVVDFCTTNNLSINGLINAVFGFVLAKHMKIDKSGFVSVYNGRGDSRFQRSLGCFTSVLPVLCDINSSMSVISYVKMIESQINESIANHTYAMYDVNSEEKASKSYDVLLSYDDVMMDVSSFCNESIKLIRLKDNVEDPDDLPLKIDIFSMNNEFLYHFNRPFAEKFTKDIDRAIKEFITKEKLMDISLST